MFSLFHEKPPEESPAETKTALPRLTIPPVVRSHGGIAGLCIALAVVLVYGVHEHSVAAHFSAKSAQAAAELKDTRAQIGALSAKLDSIPTNHQTAKKATTDTLPERHPVLAERRAVTVIHPTGQRQKPDPRWKRVQDQLDAHGKAIESTRQEIASTRSDLQDSIAKTHEELVVLQKKGERNYVEFDLDKSKNFHPTGPVGISLRKANTKHQYADLELLVDDRQVTKKHLNLYEPAVFYVADERQPVELVINSISKNHIRGYVSAGKYRTSELTAVH